MDEGQGESHPRTSTTGAVTNVPVKDESDGDSRDPSMDQLLPCPHTTVAVISQRDATANTSTHAPSHNHDEDLTTERERDGAETAQQVDGAATAKQHVYVNATITAINGDTSIPHVRAHVRGDLCAGIAWSNFQIPANVPGNIAGKHTDLRVITGSGQDRHALGQENLTNARDSCHSGKGKNGGREGWLEARVDERAREFGFCEAEADVYRNFVSLLSLFDDEAMEQVRIRSFCMPVCGILARLF